jgi:hypothetical protein
MEGHLQGMHAQGCLHQDTHMGTHTWGYPWGHMYRGNKQKKYAWENKYAQGDIHMGGHICLRGYIRTGGQRLMEGIYEDKYMHGDKYLCRAYPRTVKSRSPSPVPELRLRNSLGFPQTIPESGSRASASVLARLSFVPLASYIYHPYLVPTHSPLVLTSLPLRPFYLIVPSRDSDSSYHI